MPDSHTSKSPYQAHSLLRGLGILDAIATASEPTTLTELHEQTGHPKSTLVRMLAVLEGADYVIKVDERPAYRLGPAVLPIVSGYLQSGSIGEVVRPHLKRLALETGWTANFGVLDGTNVRHVSVEFPDRPLHYMSTEGALAPAYCTGLGKAILAALPEEDARAAVPGTLPALTPATLTTWSALARDLAATRERGYAIDAGEADVGLRCLAVAVRSGGEVIGAVSVAGPAGESDEEREATFVATLRSVRDALEQQRGLGTAVATTP